MTYSFQSLTFKLSIFAIILIATTASAKINISVQVDKTHMTRDDYLSLEVTISQSGQGGMFGLPEPEYPDLTEWNILGQSSSQRMNIVNFQMEASKTIHLQLQPLKAGKLTIGSFQVKDAKSQPIVIDVANIGGSTQLQEQQPQQSRPDPGEANINSTILLRAEVDKKEVYIGEQILYRWLFYHDRRSNLPISNISAEFPDFTGFRKEDIQGPFETLRVINGRQYKVSEFRIPIFPLRSGEIEIDPATANLSYDPFFGFGFRSRRNTQNMPDHLPSNTVKLNVKPLPVAGQPKDFRGAVGRYQITARVDKHQAKAGTPVTLTVIVKGYGDIKSLRAIELGEPDNLKVYEPKVTTDISKRSERVQGQITYEYVLIPKKEGRAIIPAFTLPFFNPETEQYQRTQTRPITLTVLKGEEQDFGPGPGPVHFAMKDEVKSVGSSIRYIKTDLKEVKHGALYFVETRTFQALLGAPLFFLMIGGLYHKRQEKYRTDVAFARRRKARGKANKFLAQAQQALKNNNNREFFAEISKAITSFVADKRNLPAAGLTREDLEEILSTSKVEDSLRQSIVDILDTCDFGRFSASQTGTEEMETVLEKSTEVLTSLDKAL